MMRLPDFLIIGAMKAGTTSLYHDLSANPAVFMPTDKELWSLAQEEVCQPEGLQRYAKHFRKASTHQTCGEASTVYSQLPDITGVPQRARQVLGDQFKAIYLVREPVSRIISHHYHEWSAGKITCSIDQAVRTYPRLINYSRYAMQITPWLEALGSERVLIVRFETYINDRRPTVASISRFLGVEPCLGGLRIDKAYNKSEGKPVARGALAGLRRSRVYRRILRPILTPSARERLRFALLPKAAGRPDPPSVETVRHIFEQVRDDAEQLRVLMGRTDPLWDFQAALRRCEEQTALQP